MTDPRDLQRLEREEWFVEMRRWYSEGIVEGMDGATYRGRDVLPREINLSWVRSRMNAAKIESGSPGWILGILEEGFHRDGDPMPLQGSILKAILENEKRG